MKDLHLALMAASVQASSAANMFGANVRSEPRKITPPKKTKRAKAKAARKSNLKRMKSAK